MNLIEAIELWLRWLDSEEGLEYRKNKGLNCNDYDLACTIPNPPGSAIITIKDLRDFVNLIESLRTR